MGGGGGATGTLKHERERTAMDTCWSRNAALSGATEEATNTSSKKRIQKSINKKIRNIHTRITKIFQLYATVQRLLSGIGSVAQHKHMLGAGANQLYRCSRHVFN